MNDATLRLALSPCPNDTFVFHALVHGLVAPDLAWDVRMEDVETLNAWARDGTVDVAKISYHAFGRLADAWWMLPAGGALGRGVGPLVVTRERHEDLRGRRVAIPGGWTTANLLLKLWAPDGLELVEMRYDRIMPAVAAGDVDAGLIIHESRFTYPRHGLTRHVDLGSWWESTTGAAIPLGGVAVRRDLPGERIDAIAAAVAASVEAAFADPSASADWVARHAQEMSPDVRRRHIELYVNEFSRDLGAEGRAAVRTLFDHAAERGVLPPVRDDLVWEPAGVAGRA